MDLVEAIRPYLTVKINDMATWLVPILNVIANQPQAAAIILNNPDSVVLKKITDPIRQKQKPAINRGMVRPTKVFSLTTTRSSLTGQLAC